jgi:pimeloyl-ACP methyl ester carboxylesterase
MFLLPLLEGLDLHVPDRPGYNGTPAGGFFSGAEQLLADLAEQPPMVLVGQSWGAGVALAAALEAPDRAAGLLLITPVGSPLAVSRFDRLVARPRLGALFAATMQVAAPHSAGLAARAVGSRIDPATRRAVSAELKLRDMRTAWRAWHVEQAALIRETPTLYARAADVRVRTIVLGGSRDTAVPPAAARDLASRIPDADYRELDAGHLLTLEYPDTVAAAIRELA